MSETLVLWIFGSVIGLMGVMLRIIYDAQGKLDNRLIGVEKEIARANVFIEVYGDKLMKVMHREDDCHGADWYFDEYKRRNGELTPSQWSELRSIYVRVIEEGEARHSRGELVGASGIIAFCEHKLKGFPGYNVS